MSDNDRGVSRRTVLGTMGAAVTTASLAGCVGGGGEDSMTATWGGASSEQTDCFDCVHPQPVFEIPDRVNNDDADVEINYIGGGELCAEGDCGEQLLQGNYPLTQNSITNATNWFNELDVFTPAYTVPVDDSGSIHQGGVADMLYDPDVLEEFWVPFANQYGVLPFAMGTPELRVIWMSSEWDGTVRTPEDIEGAEIRRTPSTNEAEVIEAWGAESVDITWGENVQGMESGVVDGFVSWASVNFAAGAADVTSQAVVTNHMVGMRMSWVDVEWLKSLDDASLDSVARHTKEVSEELVQMVPDVLENMGQVPNQDMEGSEYDNNDISVTFLDESDMHAWKSPVRADENPGLYEDAIESAEELASPGVFDTILEAAQTPSPVENYEFESWWDDILDQIEI